MNALDKAIKLMDTKTHDSIIIGYFESELGKRYKKEFSSQSEFDKFLNEIRKNKTAKLIGTSGKASDAQNRKTFFSKQKQQEFAEYLKRQGAKNIRLSVAADPLNKGGRYYYVDWYMDNAR